jgi:hypothetical protein
MESGKLGLSCKQVHGRIALEFSFGKKLQHGGIGGSRMPDWIDKLKKDDDTKAKASQHQSEVRLRNDKVIAAKAPGLWDTLIKQITTDAAKLNDAFPTDASRQCDVIQQGHAYVLQNRRLPFSILVLSINFAASQIDVRTGTKNSGGPANMQTDSPICFTLDFQDELQFEWLGTKYSDMALLSERLIKRVLGNH